MAVTQFPVTAVTILFCSGLSYFVPCDIVSTISSTLNLSDVKFHKNVVVVF